MFPVIERLQREREREGRALCRSFWREKEGGIALWIPFLRESYNVTRTWYWVTLEGCGVLNY